MTHLYFIRHGLSQLNVEDKVAGVTETPLTNTGKKQAKVTAQKVKTLGIDHTQLTKKPRILQGSCRTRDKAVLSDRDVAMLTSKEEKLVNLGLAKSEVTGIF